jgi:hypothetical protein
MFFCTETARVMEISLIVKGEAREKLHDFLKVGDTYLTDPTEMLCWTMHVV